MLQKFARLFRGMRFYGVFSKSGFTQRMMDIAKESVDILLVNEDHLV